MCKAMEEAVSPSPSPLSRCPHCVTLSPNQDKGFINTWLPPLRLEVSACGPLAMVLWDLFVIVAAGAQGLTVHLIARMVTTGGPIAPFKVKSPVAENLPLGPTLTFSTFFPFLRAEDTFPNFQRYPRSQNWKVQIWGVASFLLT